MEEAARFKLLEEGFRNLEERLEALESSRVLGSTTLQIQTFAPEPYGVKRPIPVVVQRLQEGFTASFVDANVNSSGDSQQEAYANVKELILDVFDSLRSLPASRLGPGPTRQLAVLREFIDAPEDHQGAREEDR
jgi:predicted RNase H-like HicB family nuclease